MNDIVALESKVVEAVVSPLSNFVTQVVVVHEPIISGAQGPQGIAGVSSGTAIDELVRPSYISDHPGTLTKGMAVCLINGMLRRATSVAPFHNVIGLVFEDTLAQGVSGRVQTSTNITTTSLTWDIATGMVGGLSSGQMYFLTSTGAITPFPPTSTNNYIIPVGLALSSVTIRISFNSSVLI